MVESRLESDDGNAEILAIRKALLHEVEWWYKRKCELWRQMSREQFVKDMNKNSKYFHTVATMRKRKKMILEIKVGG